PSGAAIYRRAGFHLAEGDSTAYRSEVREAMHTESLDFDTKMELMTGFVRDSYSDPQQQPGIVELFDEMIAQYPREAALRDLYTSYLHAIEDLPGAAEQIEYAVDVDPSDETRWRNLVALYIQLDNYDKATDAAGRALHYFPGSVDFITTVGSGMLIAGDYAGAEEYLQKTLAEADSSNVDLYGYILTQLGDIANHNGNPDGAIEYYEQARKYTPRNALLLNNYAYILAEQRQRLDEAEQMSAESLINRPDEPTYLDTYAWVLFQKKDFQGARKMIDRAIEHSQQPQPDILEHAGDIYFFLGETDDAISFWEQAYQLDPDNQTLKTKVETRSYPIR
ncbi:MAG: tetratricopeptide repeat protein, partial [Muribaculum sp.]|nr:tetratricopeptide repeat protein [Muribaculum sp.]